MIELSLYEGIYGIIKIVTEHEIFFFSLLKPFTSYRSRWISQTADDHDNHKRHVAYRAVLQKAMDTGRPIQLLYCTHQFITSDLYLIDKD